MAYDLKYLLSVDQRLQRLETTGTFEGTYLPLYAILAAVTLNVDG